MSKREARPVFVLAPRPPSRYDAAIIGMCPLCRAPIGEAATVWCHIVGDGEGVRRSVHAACAHSYGLYLSAMGSRV